jgi:1,4-dihydroxy-2-naphthoate octaprenyltransferase
VNPAFQNWARALRAYSFAATVIPVTCAFLFARAQGLAVAWPLFPLMLSCALLLHAGVNLLNDYYDFILGFDTAEARGSSGLLIEGIVRPEYMLRWGRFYIAGGAAAGLALAAARGWPLLVMGTAGLAGAWF